MNKKKCQRLLDTYANTGAVDFLSTVAIMYLTGQPEGECRSPDPAKVNTKLSEIAVPKL